MDMRSVVTPVRFAKGMTFDEYVKFIGSPENLSREGFDIRRFSQVRPRLNWSGFFRERYTKAALTTDQTAAIRWLAAQPGGPAKMLVISEDWSSDCRRDVPYLARLAEAGGLELRVFTRDGDAMLMSGLPDLAAGGNADLVVRCANEKNGQRWASIPVAVFFTSEFRAVPLRRIPGHLPQGHRDASLALAARGRVGGTIESPRRKRHCDAADLALFRRVGGGGDCRDPQRALRTTDNPGACRWSREALLYWLRRWRSLLLVGRSAGARRAAQHAPAHRPLPPRPRQTLPANSLRLSRGRRAARPLEGGPLDQSRDRRDVPDSDIGQIIRSPRRHAAGSTLAL